MNTKDAHELLIVLGRVPGEFYRDTVLLLETLDKIRMNRIGSPTAMRFGNYVGLIDVPDSTVIFRRPDLSIYAILSKFEIDLLRERKRLESFLKEERESGKIVEPEAEKC